MSAFSKRVAELTGADEERMERLAGGDVSGALLVERPEGGKVVAKGGMTAVEAMMLRRLAEAGVPVPPIEGEYDGVLLLGFVDNDALFSPRAWADLGETLRRLHLCRGEDYGWPVDFAADSVLISNRPSRDWGQFWADERLIAPASLLDRPWRERIAAAAEIARRVLPAAPEPALLHGDMWRGNVLVADGAVAALIDPICYYGHAEADLAMLSLFDAPPDEFREAYGPLEDDAEVRRPIYELFHAIVHMRLYGPTYGPMLDRLLAQVGA
jgi:fructosamine-3-kinase